MKKDILKYRGFIAAVHFSADDEVFFGKIEGINDLITFEGEGVKELQEAFKKTVDDYIELCKRAGKEAHRSYKGSFNVRMNPELHNKAVRIATEEGISLNQFVQDAVEHEVNEREVHYGTDGNTSESHSDNG